MNAKDQALFDAEIAKLTVQFKTAMTEALQPLVLEINELQQRSSNFAARVNASNKIYRAEITRLRELVEATQPKKVVPLEPRISAAQWDAGMAALRAKNPGQTFFAPSLVRAEAKAIMTVATPAKEPTVEVDLDNLVMEEEEYPF